MDSAPDGMLEFPCGVERLDNGNTLIVDAGDEYDRGSEVIEVDPRGSVVRSFSHGYRFAHSANTLADGQLLVTDTSNNRLLIVNGDGDVTLSSDDWGDGSGTLSDGSHLAYPNDAHELDDGTLLVTDRNNNRLVIVDRNGRVHWQHADGVEHPHNADPLPNGNIVFANSDANIVMEITRDGTVVWQYGDGTRATLNNPRDADRLANGNTLVTDSRNHRVLEITPDGSIAWQWGVDYYAAFYEADALDNGNVLISDQHHHRIIEVARNGSIVWMFRNRRLDHEVYPRLHNGGFREWADDDPVGWKLYSRFAEGSGRLIADSTGDRRYPGLEYDGHGVLMLVQYVVVSPGTRYTFAGKIRTEGIADGHAANFQVFFLDEYGGPISNTAEAPKGIAVTGTTDWTEDSFEAVAPERATMAEVRLMVNGPGKVWMRSPMFFS